MICFPARGDDSEEQRKRLQQQVWSLVPATGNTSFSQQLPDSRWCNYCRGATLLPGAEHGSCPPTRPQWTRGLYNTILMTELKVLA